MDRAAAVELVRGLVAIPSLSRQEAEASAWLVEQMKGAGYERAFVDDAGNAVGELGDPAAARIIVLLGHIDTVPGNIPVRIEDLPPASPTLPAQPALFGRGSVDAKGPLATLVAGAARFGAHQAHASGIRVVVVGAVEEEAATSKGARFIAERFDGKLELMPVACVIGEPSDWRRVTLGYKGRMLLDLVADQPMAHTAGPDASVAAVVVDLWNWVTAYAARVNEGRERAFDQLTPSLRRFITSTNDEMHDRVDAQIAWRIPVGFDADGFIDEIKAWPKSVKPAFQFTFRGIERAWRADRSNPLVRSFLAALREEDPAAQLGFVLKTGTSDMNVVAPAWHCPIVAYGPGDSALDHTPNEHLPLDDYWHGVRIVEKMLQHFSGS